MTDLPEWARRLDLSPHPEGGWFRETWRSELTIRAVRAARPTTPGPRNAGTAILFLLMPGQQSAWHTVRSAELWLFHRGSPLLLEVGAEQERRDRPSARQRRRRRRARRSSWCRRGTGSAPAPGTTNPRLVSCVVVPGFDFADFALGAPTD